MKRLRLAWWGAAAITFSILVACANSGAPGAGDGTVLPTASSSPAPTGTETATPPATSTGIVGGSATVTPEPSVTTTAVPSSSPTPLQTMEPSLARLKYVLFDRFGRLWYCDPDFYPVAREDEQTLAQERFPEIEADAGTFGVILEHLGIAPAAEYSGAQQLAVYQDWKMLRALPLDPVSGGYHFDARFTRDQRSGLLVEGTITSAGEVSVAAQQDAGPPNCPICLARGTRIATPEGPVPVEALRVGMQVWTEGSNGQPQRARVLAVGSTPVAASHQLVHLVLADGRELRASPGHALVDGRLLGGLAVGESVDGSTVARIALEAYTGGMTFDLLPSGPTGTYWADGVPLATTMAAP